MVVKKVCSVAWKTRCLGNSCGTMFNGDKDSYGHLQKQNADTYRKSLMKAVKQLKRNICTYVEFCIVNSSLRFQVKTLWKSWCYYIWGRRISLWIGPGSDSTSWKSWTSLWSVCRKSEVKLSLRNLEEGLRRYVWRNRKRKNVMVK